MVHNVQRSLTSFTTSMRYTESTQAFDQFPDSSRSRDSTNIVINISSNDGSTGRGILIGMLSAFGSAAFVVLLFAIVYFFRYTRRGRIFLDRIGRPGEYDDEQAYAREEAEALDEMDDIQRAEYLRAKGEILKRRSSQTSGLTFCSSLCSSEPTRDSTYRHLPLAISCHSRERCLRVGI